MRNDILANFRDSQPSRKVENEMKQGAIKHHIFAAAFLMLAKIGVILLAAFIAYHAIIGTACYAEDFNPVNGIWPSIGKQNEGLSIHTSGDIVVVTEFYYNPSTGKQAWIQGAGKIVNNVVDMNMYSHEMCEFPESDFVCQEIIGIGFISFLSDSTGIWFPPDRLPAIGIKHFEF